MPLSKIPALEVNEPGQINTLIIVVDYEAKAP
jgi:hypothetical protein